MIASEAINDNRSISPLLPELLTKRASESDTPEVFTDIYRDDTNIAIWQRKLSDELALAVDDILKTGVRVKVAEAVTVQSVNATLCNALGASSAVMRLSEDITLLVDMFCCLFDLKEVGLRLTALDRAMCPRFHFDRIPCRLVTTYHGVATEWLPHQLVDRSKLGSGNQGKSDEQSGLFDSTDDIRQLSQGDVGLLKGEFWHNNEGAGLVHRSPAQSQDSINERRLLLTLDFINN
ncbi:MULTISPECIES: DUF1826 domain-containing protein [unclassified Colwellia]|jgi:hypothetical protein|uniref:DUF1826 domain-containing protein n=1 Tax=unclassified Colwellia TaxID=196834 RepID=UPI0015F6CD22|nr:MULTISPECIES: DUF1826 domain-containing protein [unclassified Colwellia]MBA6253302.1 DUF1826 domain-containing protein [Colwellia sp. MB3u-55]MBA6397852.1 DUF1826 domain-containing protein [Colwellia sp. BRX10-4]